MFWGQSVGYTELSNVEGLLMHSTNYWIEGLCNSHCKTLSPVGLVSENPAEHLMT